MMKVPVKAPVLCSIFFIYAAVKKLTVPMIFFFCCTEFSCIMVKFHTVHMCVILLTTIGEVDLSCSDFHRTRAWILLH
jgi:hypothetical protein